MSEKKFLPGGIAAPLFSAFFGASITALTLFGMAHWMVYQGWSASKAAPLASVAVCVGSLCGGACAAFCKKERGLVNGAIQGLFFAGVLLLAALGDGNTVETSHLIRCAAVLLCGAVGGLLGMNLRDRKH